MNPILKFLGIPKTINQIRLNHANVELEEDIIRYVNKFETDVDRIIELENIKGQQNNFVIINKSKSQADIYKNGKKIDEFEVGVGEIIGDDLNSAAYSNGSFSKEGRTTPSGQFFTKAPYGFDIANKKDYDDGKCINLLLLKGVQHPADFRYNTALALHQIPQSHPERLEMFNTRGVRRSMSTGCVNFRPNDFYRLTEEIKPSGTPVYILPEDKGNKLELVSLPNGLWLKTKYADNEKENIFLDAMKKFFRINER